MQDIGTQATLWELHMDYVRVVDEYPSPRTKILCERKDGALL